MSKLSTTTSELAPSTKLKIHPGRILREEFLEEYGISAGALAKAINVPRDRVEKIIREERSITADTAARLGRCFGTSAQFWLNMQNGYDLACLDENDINAVSPLAA